jgi:hypothetical protein
VSGEFISAVERGSSGPDALGSTRIAERGYVHGYLGSEMSQKVHAAQRLTHARATPAGTPPKKVLAAVKNFAREEFGAKHQYAMVFHTGEPHPHVQMVVKAMGYDGNRRGGERHRARDHGVRASPRRLTVFTGRRCAAPRHTGASGQR